MKKDRFARLKRRYNALNARADRLNKEADRLRNGDEFTGLAYLRAARSLQNQADDLIDTAAVRIEGDR